jgi:flagellar biosynthesis protein FlhG
VNGQVLKKLREARGLSLDELAELTKIRRPYLQAIEDQDLENLPARVYLRGFLTQIARALRVDKTRLAEGYVSFVARFGG